MMELSKDIWNGYIGIELELSYSDVTSMQKPGRVYLLASRLSYLPITVSEIVSYFQQSAIEFSSEIWFECEGKPIKSNIPIGVLYDSFNQRNLGVPWKIVVHFQGFPYHTLVKCSTQLESEHYYFHSLKQALFMIYGNTRLFNELSVEEQKKLWLAVQTTNQQLYEEVADRFRPSVQCDSKLVKSLPIRVLRPQKPTVQRPVSLTSSGDCNNNQNNGNNNVYKTLREVLCSDFGVDLRQSLPGNHLSTPSTQDELSLKIIIQGIEVPLDSPILELWSIMRHCDFFLYITLLENQCVG